MLKWCLESSHELHRCQGLKTAGEDHFSSSWHGISPEDSALIKAPLKMGWGKKQKHTREKEKEIAVFVECMLHTLS